MSERRGGWRGLRRGLIAVGLLLVAACSPPLQQRQERLLVFGSEATLEIIGVPMTDAGKAVAAVSAEFAQLDGEWHAWRASDLTRINAAFARGESAPAPASIRKLIPRMQPWVRQSDGLFDPGIGGLVALWGFHSDEFPLRTPAPSDAQLDAWLERRPSLLDVHVDGDLLRSDNPAVQLDFGSIGEGAAAERALRLLARHGVDNALLSLGGDIVARGNRAGQPWQIGLRDPFGDERAVLARVQLGDGEALFTSGNYSRFRMSPSGQRWPHILDPRTARPSSGVSEVAVLDRDPLLADAVSTLLMVAGPARFAELLERLRVNCALLLTDQNELMITAAMAERVQLLRQPVSLGPPLGRSGPCGAG